MATETSEDFFQAIREAVSQTLDMAEAQSKISDETRELLSQLILTRRGDGEIVLDMSAHQKMKAGENSWVNKERNDQDRYINPTRLPQLVPGLSGLTSGQYLAFVQRPLDRNGDNAPFLVDQSLRLYDQYHHKDLAAERNKLFGHYQRHVAKILIDDLLSKEHDTSDQEELDKLRAQTPPQKQFEMAAKALDISTTEVMNNLFKYAIALYNIERIKTKAVQLKKAQQKFELILRKLANTDSGPTAKTRVKDIFLGFQKDLTFMAKEIGYLNNKAFQPIIEKMHKESFQDQYLDLHRHGARLDALATRWVIIFNEANNQDNLRTTVEKIKGMHTVFMN
ncbi:hypothetical protein MTBPR1_40040 [Candidatus Terasakiella magnetica]|uniref:Uncharacterized protein n=1 Tax=Candidatus Terasakiella magnetica TaxID=1867952 RepID=A0A1C3RIA7_9PROT|nr:hypothetical protein [Candidatus Terasakiella magnetica]SCA57017.1 hypothetical protein MTBPR1_40040 [Candidatus Terasakiella magnetica]